MRVLVTGGAGYIGSHMVYELVDAGEDVVVLDNLSTGYDWAVASQAELVVGDAGDSALLDQLLTSRNISAIIHFAGSIVVPESIEDPLGYYENNTVKSRALMAAAVKAGVPHFIFSSTAAVYGMPDRNPVFEDARLNPISPYGSSKLMTEIMLKDTAFAHNLNYVALRYFNVAGADPHGRTGQSTPRATHLIKVASQTALGERPALDVYGTDYDTPDGTCIRDYIHVTDLVRAHLDALKFLRAGGRSQVLNCGYGQGYSVLEVVEAVKRASGVDFTVNLTGRRPGDPAALIAGADKIRQILYPAILIIMGKDDGIFCLAQTVDFFDKFRVSGAGIARQRYRHNEFHQINLYTVNGGLDAAVKLGKRSFMKFRLLGDAGEGDLAAGIVGYGSWQTAGDNGIQPIFPVDNVQCHGQAVMFFLLLRDRVIQGIKHIGHQIILMGQAVKGNGNLFDTC